MKQRYTKLKSVALAALTMGLALGAQAAEKCTDCITFSADQAFGIKMTKGANCAVSVNLEYSTDQKNWSKFEATGTAYAAAKSGDTYKIHLRGTNNTAFASRNPNGSGTGVVGPAYSHVITSDSSTPIACSGNIETLLDYTTVKAGNHPTMGDYAFAYLFYDFINLQTAPALPATKLTPYCYASMFRARSQTNLMQMKKAPSLPATTLAPFCYYAMFSCSSLTDAPALPATTLEDRCYSCMFWLSSLTNPPELLPAKTLATQCYRQMFQKCPLTTLPKLPATTLADECYYQMFLNCTNLVVNTAPRGKEWKISATSDTGATDWNTEMFGLSTGVTPVEPRTIPAKPALNTTYYIKSAKGTELGNGLYAYDQGDGTYSVNGGVSAALTKAMADAIKDKGITNLVIGAGVSGVGASAFDGWRSLRSVEMGADCASVGSQSFLECYNLTNVTSKASTAVSVGDHAFYRCNSLESMDFGVLPSFGTQSFTLQAGIYMKDGLPQVYSIPDITVGGTSKRHVYGTVELGSKADWVDVTAMTDEQRKAYHFFKIVAE